MPRLDDCHPQMVHALRKDLWDVDQNPKRLRSGRRVIFIDIRAVQRSNGTVR
jgi:hypothetical protein